MYLPPLFRSDDLALARRVADESPLATWVCAMPDGSLEIAHLPSLWHEREGKIVVRAHVARANPLGAIAAQQARATVLFHGPHAYVSPTWYEHPDEQVPTWNYVVVHASGGLRVLDPGASLAHLGALATRFEGDQGWSPAALRDDLFADIARGVIGIELAVEKVEHKRKLSQNRSPADRSRVLDRLDASADPGARAMARAGRQG